MLERMLLVVAFAGKIGSGKTTITKSLAELLGWPRASFGDYVRSVLHERGLQETRQNLQRIGTQLLENDSRGFCSSVLLSCGWKAGQNLIVDGLRHVETIDIIREIVQPATLRIVFVSVSDETRLRRLKQRGEGDIASVERHSSEQQVSSVLQRRADLLIEGNRAANMIVAELTDWIRNQ